MKQKIFQNKNMVLGIGPHPLIPPPPPPVVWNNIGSWSGPKA